MATTLEKFEVALEANRILSNVRRDTRQNAQETKDRISDGTWTAEFAAGVVVDQAKHYLASLKRISDHKTLVKNALSDLGIDTTETEADWKELRDAGVHARDDTLSDGSNVTTICDDLIALPSKTQLF